MTNHVSGIELKLQIERKPSQALLRGKGRITSATSDILHSAFRGLIPGTKSIVLDVTDVDCIDSSGLNALLGVYLSVQRAGCELQLSNRTRARRSTFTSLVRNVSRRLALPAQAPRTSTPATVEIESSAGVVGEERRKAA